MKTDDSLALFNKLFISTYAPYKNVFVRGAGSYLYDKDRRSYLDFCSGIAVNNLGHCHPEIVRAIQEQAGRLMHISNLYIHDIELSLAGRMVDLTFPGRLFLCQSGAEANEAAMKLARKYARAVLKQDRYKFITAKGSFHGRTLGTIAATGQDKYKVDFEPLPEGFTHVPYNDIGAFQKAVDENTCAILVEPIQGEGGVVLPDEGFLANLRRLCTDRGILLILDEVQTGFGRTGTLFAYQQEGITPDIITMAKAFGGGLPLGGIMATSRVARAFSPGNHATTFGANPVTCAAALATLKVIESENLLDNTIQRGAQLFEGLSGLMKNYPTLLRAVRGRGLLVGVELLRGGQEIISRCHEKGLLLSCVQENVIRFTPPLTVTSDEVEHALEIFRQVCSQRAEELGV